jgi:lipoprotein-anchoring transpeptidase ErfK/SrfK
MMRFTYGPDTKSPIGFHSIPKYYDGTPMHSTKQLGLAIARGGCVRLSEEASKALYKFMKVGDLVVVLPSP